MADDIKSLTKKNVDLEKRLKVAEAKIKALADNMTNSRDIQKFMDVVEREQTDTKKTMRRIEELADKESKAYRKEMEKELEKQDAKYRKENDKYEKEAQKEYKEMVRKAELSILENRLRVVEALVQAALAK